MAGVKFEAHYSVTSVDPPELVRFIRENYPDVARDIPRDSKGNPVTMWTLLAKNDIPPSRKYRYCCEQLKEVFGRDRVTVTGVRWAESARRKEIHGVVDFQTSPIKTRKIAEYFGLDFKVNRRGGVMLDTSNVVMNDDNELARRMVENCYRTSKTLVNPIVDWTDENVWEFLNKNHIPHCCLYDEGYKRLGCIGCPMAGSKKRNEEFERWPKYKEMYIRAFEKMIASHPNHIKFFNDLDDPPKDNREAAEILFDHWLNIDFISESGEKYVPSIRKENMEGGQAETTDY